MELEERLNKVLQNSRLPQQENLFKNKEELANLRETQRLAKKALESSQNLTSLIYSTKEIEELQYTLNFYEARIQGMMDAVLENLKWYEDDGWKKFTDEDDAND